VCVCIMMYSKVSLCCVGMGGGGGEGEGGGGGGGGGGRSLSSWGRVYFRVYTIVGVSENLSAFYFAI